MFIIQHAVAEALELGIGDLIAELLAHTFVFGCFFKSAGTVSILSLQPLAYCLNYFFVFIKSYCHWI